ncbi:MAG TPA: DUF1015 domain-containing protein [Chitinispirillaceae bacterium]|nr:DUF1015 domain-containing protein [Chitinispirillaceae bacterium]
MAGVKPFKGYRYQIANPKDLTKVIAPPYDMMDSDMVDALYQKDSHNSVRLIQNRPEPQDTCNKDRHVRAASIFKKWVNEGVLVQDQKQSVYIYQQTFKSPVGKEMVTFVRTGVIALVELVDFEKKIVLPHEYTLSGPKIDRFELMDASQVDMGLIFGLVSDEGDTYNAIKSLINDKAAGVAVDENGVEHRLYVCSDESLINHFVHTVKDSTILIADGHHRYETALNYYKDKKSQGYSHVMMALVSMADPGLVIRSFHRLIRKTDRQIVMKDQLKKFFRVVEYGNVTEDTVYDFMSKKLDAEILYIDSKDQTASGLFLSGDGEKFLETAMPERSMNWKQLSVSEINVIVINTILGLPLDGKVLHDVVDYVNDINAGLQKLKDAGAFHGGFFIRPETIDSIHKIVAGDERMPQKSTNFYPKLFSGLVFNRLSEI